jgi:hypothetical protein
MKKIKIGKRCGIGKQSCSLRNCDNKAVVFLKLSVASMGGWFCNKCAAELQQSGLLEEVKQSQNTPSPPSFSYLCNSLDSYFI